MSKNIVKRLTEQLRANGVADARKLAVAKLTQYGELKNGKLTAKGKKRQEMGAAGRAIDRASKTSGRPASGYNYNPKTNRATLKK